MRPSGQAALGLVAAVVVMLATAQAGAQSEREALEQQLKEQEARNEGLRQRIEKLEVILQSDVCADPQAAELVLKETQTPEPVESPAR
jgi:predicted transposase YdaD